MNVDELLTHAEGLAARDASQASLRRAMSAAYYAIFHERCSLIADQFLGRERRATKEYARCYRTLNHQTVAKGAALYASAGGADTFAHFVCNTARDARIERSLADYDPHYQTTTENLETIAFTARLCVDALRAMSAEEKLRLATALVFPERRD